MGVVLGRYKPLEPDTDATLPPESDGGYKPPEGPVLLGKFYGKCVDLDGAFRGWIRGVYGRSVHDIGVFYGHYYDADGEETGVLLGRWTSDPQLLGGPFFGIWFGEELSGEP
jgi:hypothetical protein